MRGSAEAFRALGERLQEVTMGKDERAPAADKLDSEGEDPAAESGAGYGSHAPDAEPAEAEDDRAGSG